jgi:hypothetical protein
MSIETQWLLESAVLVQRFAGKPSLNEFDDASYTLSNYIPRNRKLHIIGDFSALQQVPDELHNIGDTLNATLSRSYMGWFITIGSHDTALNFAAGLMSHFTRVQHKHFQNQDEAYEFLSMMDASLPLY